MVSDAEVSVLDKINGNSNKADVVIVAYEKACKFSN